MNASLYIRKSPELDTLPMLRKLALLEAAHALAMKERGRVLRMSLACLALAVGLAFLPALIFEMPRIAEMLLVSLGIIVEVFRHQMAYERLLREKVNELLESEPGNGKTCREHP